METDIKSFSIEELRQELLNRGEKVYRAGQIYEWMHQKLARGFEEMTNLPAALRQELARDYQYMNAQVIEVQESKEDGTRKYLFGLWDGELVESVFMPYKHGNSVCISSQAGCRMGCSFCASTLDGLKRNLTPSEMLEQVYAISRHTGERVSNVVVMGSGEPLDNYENLLRFLKLITKEEGLNISQRNITVSTCGLVPQIYKLAEEKLQITLALSLHGVTDKKRQELMPIARRYSIEELMAACSFYYQKTNRRLTFEYSLIDGINDGEEDAALLCGLAKPLNVHVNLIPVNPVKEREYRQSQGARIKAFKNKLEKNKINVTIRREMGRDIEGACGQLRRRYSRKPGQEDDIHA